MAQEDGGRWVDDEATFNNPIAVAADATGTIVIADTDNHAIRSTRPPSAGPGRHRAVNTVTPRSQSV